MRKRLRYLKIIFADIFIRLALMVKKPTEKERLLEKELKDCASKQVLLVEEKSEAKNVWAQYNNELVNLLRYRDPRGFLRWLPIRTTMKTGQNAVNQCSNHITSFKNWLGGKPDLGTVFEFGGGYGCMCRVMHELSFNGKYVIYDLPALTCLQNYYLKVEKLNGVHCVSTLDDLNGKLFNTPRQKLFVATWSLSEAPIKLREYILKLIESFDLFLIAYQKTFREIDNTAFFKNLTNNFNYIDWHDFEISGLAGSHYLFGKRKT